MELNPRFKEILRLHHMLLHERIPHSIERDCDGWILYYPTKQNRICDAVEFTGTYGYTQDKLEILGLLTNEEEQNDSVLGDLDAEEVFKRIVNHHHNQKENLIEKYVNFFERKSKNEF